MQYPPEISHGKSLLLNAIGDSRLALFDFPN